MIELISAGGVSDTHKTNISRSSTEAVLTGLLPNTSYCFAVGAVNSVGIAHKLTAVYNVLTAGRFCIDPAVLEVSN